jgi:hypothetical protein
MALAATGTISYNNISFGSHVHTKITGRVVPDESKRVTKWVEYTIEIAGWLSGDDMDDSWENIRQRMARPAQELKILEKGFGPLHVNGTSRVRDANWGPWPEIVSWTPLGGDRSVAFTLRIVTCIPECDSQVTRYDGLIALNYEVYYSIDGDGYTERQITGHIEIAQTRQRGSSKVKESADEYRDRFRPDIPLGFKRETENFRLSMNRNRGDFIYVDRELPVALPDGATTCEFKHSVSSGLAEGFFIWRSQIRGSITLPQSVNKKRAYEIFLSIMSSRLSRIPPPKKPAPTRQWNLLQGVGDVLVGGGGGILGGKPNLNPTVIVDRMEIGEEIFGRKSDFSVDYRILGVPLSIVLEYVGLWDPIAGTSFAKWKASTIDAFGGRGTAKMKYIANQETLIDLCVSPTASPPGSQMFAVPGPRNATLVNQRAIKGNGKDPDPASSWLRYSNTLRVVEQNRTVRHKKLSNIAPGRYEQGTGPDPTGPVGGGIGQAILDGIGSTAPPPPGEEDVIQTTGSAALTIEMVGQAMRVGHDVPIPRLVRVGGLQVKQIDRDVDKGIIGGGIAFPIHKATWVITYAIEGKPAGTTPDLANPVYKEDGNP